MREKTREIRKKRELDGIKKTIEGGIEHCLVDIESYLPGDNEPELLRVIVVSDNFQGKTVIEQHKMVKSLLEEKHQKMTIRTFTKERYKSYK